MHAFVCSNGLLSSCDAPIMNGTRAEIAAAFGFEAIAMHADEAPMSCVLCRPINNQEVYLTIHGMERQMYGLVIWEHGGADTFFFAPTPFDLVTILDQIARFSRAIHDIIRLNR